MELGKRGGVMDHNTDMARALYQAWQKLTPSKTLLIYPPDVLRICRMLRLTGFTIRRNRINATKVNELIAKRNDMQFVITRWDRIEPGTAFIFDTPSMFHYGVPENLTKIRFEGLDRLWR